MFAPWSQTLWNGRLPTQGFGSCAARFTRIVNFSFGQLQLETPIQKHRRESQQSSQTNLRSEPTQRRTRASASMRAKRSGESASGCKADLHTMPRAPPRPTRHTMYTASDSIVLKRGHTATGAEPPRPPPNLPLPRPPPRVREREVVGRHRRPCVCI